MAKEIAQKGIEKDFIKIVDSHGGENCKNWTAVARTLKTALNYFVKSPQKLKRIYETLKKPKCELTQYQYQKLIEIDIKTRGNHKAAISQYQSDTSLKISQCRFKETAVLGIRTGLRILVKLFHPQKKQLQTLLSRFSYTTIQMMFKSIDCKDIEDPLIQDIKLYAYKLEQAFVEYSKYYDKDQSIIFEAVSQVINRSIFRRCMFYLLLINDLKSIANDKLTENLYISPHPLLNRKIELNKKIPFFVKVVQQNDRLEKLQMFHSYNNIDDEKYKLYMHDLLEPQPHKQYYNKKTMGPKVMKFSENLKTVRGKIHQPDMHLFRGWKTVIFEHSQEELEYDSDKCENQKDKENEVLEKAMGILWP